MLQELTAFQAQLDAMRDGRLRASDFSQTVRAHNTWLAALPPRYDEVLNNLLDRLESSALFAEESCSFSRQELLDSLQLWLDKVREQLASA